MKLQSDIDRVSRTDVLARVKPKRQKKAPTRKVEPKTDGKTSWWLGLEGQAFSDAAAREQVRMQESKFGAKSHLHRVFE